MASGAGAGEERRGKAGRLAAGGEEPLDQAGERGPRRRERAVEESIPQGFRSDAPPFGCKSAADQIRGSEQRPRLTRPSGEQQPGEEMPRQPAGEAAAERGRAKQPEARPSLVRGRVEQREQPGRRAGLRRIAARPERLDAPVRRRQQAVERLPLGGRGGGGQRGAPKPGEAAPPAAGERLANGGKEAADHQPGAERPARGRPGK